MAPLAKAVLLLLSGTADTAGAQFLRAESSSLLKAAATRALEGKSSNSDLCPNIANGDPRPETMDPCVFLATDNDASCEYDKHQCSKDSEAFYTYGCHCVDAVFMCLSMAMVPCDDGGGSGGGLAKNDPKEEEKGVLEIIFGQKEKDEETMKILPFEPEPAATGICPSTVPSDSDKCSKDTPARCDYDPMYCPGEPEPHNHKWLCYCEGKKFVCVINTVICDTDEAQVQAKPILQKTTKEVTTKPIFHDDVVITSCPLENPKGGPACSGDFGNCGYDPIHCLGSSLTHHSKECSCENGRLLCYELEIACVPKPAINVVHTCPKFAPKYGDDLRCSTAVRNCVYAPFQCPRSSTTHYTKECSCEDGRFVCFESSIYCPQICEDCGNMRTKGMKRKRQDCSTLRKRQLVKNCQKLKWIQRNFCAETCINAGYTKGREECCIGGFTREN